MQFVRFAVVRLQRSPSHEKGGTFQLLGAKVEVVLVESKDNPKDKSRYFLRSTISVLNSTEPIEERIEAARAASEQAIEAAANAMSVVDGIGRQLYSTLPCFAIAPEGSEDAHSLCEPANWTSRAVGIPLIISEYDSYPPHLVKAISGREDGVAALAEALSNSNMLGRYRELVRFFEIAFGMSFSQMDKKLTQFLYPGSRGYTRDEIKEWIAHRHPSIHGDGKKTNRLTWERDVVQWIQRMQQAANDVLFNKASWGSNSTVRRDIWSPQIATTSKGASIAITSCNTGVIQTQMTDYFGQWIVDMDVNIGTLPDAWFSPQRTKQSGVGT